MPAPVLQFILRFLAGGALVAAVPLIATRVGPAIAGVMVMLPVVTLLGFVFVAQTSGASAVEGTSLSALLAVPAIVAYLVVTYVSLRVGVHVSHALIAGVAAWMCVAIPIAAILSRQAGSA
jgi:uncharacterized membrane protein (GlpM family)